MALQVDTVFVWVTDLDESLEWYRQLGLEAGPRFETWQVIAVDGDTKFALHQGIRHDGPSTAVVSFLVDDLEAELDRLAGLGIEPTEAEIMDSGTVRWVTFLDPDGNEIRLAER